MKRNYVNSFGGIIIMLILTLGFAGCAKTKLELGAKAANKMCPMDMEDVGVITSITYEDNSIVYNCKITNPELSANDIESTSDFIKPFILSEMFENDDKDTKMLLDIVQDANANIIYRFTDTNGMGDIIIKTEDIKKAREEGVNNIDNMVAISNHNLAPEGLSCHKEGNSIVIVFPDGTYDFTIEDVRNLNDEIKEGIIESITPGEDMLYDFCGENGVDLVLRYEDGNGNSEDVRIYAEEIRERQ